MKNKILLTFSAALLALSCGKVAPTTEISRAPMTIVALAPEVGDDAVKSDWIYTYDICWDEDDQIYVQSSENADTFTLTGGAGTAKGTFTQDGTAVIEGSVKAYYPASIYDPETKVASWPEFQSTKLRFPLYCKKNISGSADQEFAFSSLGGVVKVYFATADPDIKVHSIGLKDATKPMSGEFTVDDDGQAVITSSENRGVTFLYKNAVAVGTVAMYFNLYVPAGTYENVSVTVASTNGALATVALDEPLVVRCGEVSKVMADGEFVSYASSGKFSVSDTKQVYISNNYLYFDGNEFHFEKIPYATHYTWQEDHICHFYWSSDSSVACGITYKDSAASESDILFTNETEDTPRKDFVVDNMRGVFRTLSAAEWEYLFFSPKRAGKYSYGVIITSEYEQYTATLLYPDDFTGERLDDRATITPAEYEGFLSQGVVFLFTTGKRYGTRLFGGRDSGDFWLSNPSGLEEGSRGYFSKYFVDHVAGDKRSYGYAIRLVCDVK